LHFRHRVSSNIIIKLITTDPLTLPPLRTPPQHHNGAYERNKPRHHPVRIDACIAQAAGGDGEEGEEGEKQVRYPAGSHEPGLAVGAVEVGAEEMIEWDHQSGDDRLQVKELPEVFARSASREIEGAPEGGEVHVHETERLKRAN